MKSRNPALSHLILLVFPVFTVHSYVISQVSRYPYQEGFNIPTNQTLPDGWESSRNRTGTVDDFLPSGSSPRAGEGCLLATNATIGQELRSPVFDCTGVVPTAAEFSLRRSSTFLAKIVVEASLDSGRTYILTLGDTLRPDGTQNYVTSRCPLPAACTGCRALRLRWRTIPESTGSTGTLRFDEFSLGVRRPAGDSRLVINEILYEASGGNAEFVEIANAGEDSVWLSGWTLSDRPGVSGRATTTSLSGMPGPIAPGGLVVVGSDSSVLFLLTGFESSLITDGSWPSLNNDGDDVVLRDPEGLTVDSVSYLPAWHTPSIVDRRGRSLERIAFDMPSNISSSWATSVAPLGCTPGRINSVAIKFVQRNARCFCTPNPFSPDADGRADATMVSYSLPGGLWRISISIYDTRGRLIRRLADDLPAASRGAVAWDGRDDRRRRVRVGMYVVLLEGWKDSDPGSVMAKCVAVVGRK
jgi:hypothetical protein